MASSLKEAAQASVSKRREYIDRVQRGVVTFFDAYFAKVIKSLVATKDIHGWNLDSPAARAPEHAETFRDLAWLAHYVADEARGRFMSYETRRREEQTRAVSDIGSLEAIMSQGVKGCLSWKGAPLFKTVYDFALTPAMLWELKPATILEIGSGCGASARWYVDLMRDFGLPLHVYSADVDPVAAAYPGVTFLRGDCNDPTTLFAASLLAEAPKPWLVVEDAHVNMSRVLAFLHAYLTPGDYLMIEDSRGKVAELDAFMGAHGQAYAVDTHFTDFFGRNATSAQNSILRRLENA